MDPESKQRISLYLDRETVEKMDMEIKRMGYRSRNEFVSSAVDNLIADGLLQENSTAVSERLSRAIAEMSEEQSLLISKGLFRYAVELEVILRMLAQVMDMDAYDLRELRKEAVRNVRRTRGKVRLDDLFQRKDSQSL